MLARVGSGQGPIRATALQTACAGAVLATGGKPVDPYLVLALSLSSDETTAGGREAVWRSRVSPPGGEQAIPSSGHPVAEPVAAPRLRVAEGSLPRGKRQRGRRRGSENSGIDDSWMVAWAPAEKAGVVTCVLVEGVGTGAAVAGPIAVEQLKGGLETLRVSP